MQTDQPPPRTDGTSSSPLSPPPTAYITPPQQTTNPSPGQSSLPPPQQTSPSPQPESPTAPPTGGIVALSARPRINMMAANKPAEPTTPPSPGAFDLNPAALEKLSRAVRQAYSDPTGIESARHRISGMNFGRQVGRFVTPPSPLGQSVVSASGEQGIQPLFDANTMAILAKPFKSPGRVANRLDEPHTEQAKGDQAESSQDQQSSDHAEKTQQAKQQQKREEEQVDRGLAIASNEKVVQHEQRVEDAYHPQHPGLNRQDFDTSTETPKQGSRRPHLPPQQLYPRQGPDVPLEARQPRPRPAADELRYYAPQGGQYSPEYQNRYDDERMPPPAPPGYRYGRYERRPGAHGHRSSAAYHPSREYDTYERPYQHPVKLVRRVPQPHPQAQAEDPFVSDDVPEQPREDGYFDSRSMKRTRDQFQPPAPMQDDQPKEKYDDGQKQKGEEKKEEEAEEEEEEEEEEEDAAPFDPTAAIEPYDYVKEVQEPWNEMMAEMVPYIDEWAEKFFAESLDTVLTVYQCFHKMSVNQGQSLQDGVDDILAQQKWQNGRRQTFIDFRKQMAKVALALGDIDPQDEEDMPVSPAKRTRRK